MKRNVVINRCDIIVYTSGIYLEIYTSYFFDDKVKAAKLFYQAFAADKNVNARIYHDCLVKGSIRRAALPLFFMRYDFPSRFVLKRIR